MSAACLRVPRAQGCAGSRAGGAQRADGLLVERLARTTWRSEFAFE
ncbi:hypothetical protein LMG24076_03642 [Trinickia soli]|nr:hypothetical protein LMG24076_03642 [Trinickia soli]